MKFFQIVVSFFILLNFNNAYAQDAETSGLSDSTIALYAVIVSILGMMGALIYNGISVKQTTKQSQYQIVKDLHEEFIELVTTGKKDQDHFIMNFINFHEKIAMLYQYKLIPKSFAKDFSNSFSESLYYINKYYQNEKENQCRHTLEWCKKFKIKSHEPEHFENHKDL